MKNEKGQVLILFLLILPMMILGGACLVDASYILYQKNRLDNINSDVLISIKNENILDEAMIEDLIVANDAKIVNREIIIGDVITIDNYIYVDSLFGQIVGLDRYKITSKQRIKYEPINSN